MKLQTVLAISVVLACLHLCSGNTSKGESCKKFCNLERNPLCAINSKGSVKTYINKCDMEAHNCWDEEDYEVVFRGNCLDYLAAIINYWIKYGGSGEYETNAKEN